MLSRVADNLYWMGRYFERADHCARVLEANYNVMLNPWKPSREQRWHRITASLGFALESGIDPQTSIARLVGEAANPASMVSCVTSARENAGQVREQISSDMWERLNQLYHEVMQSTTRTEMIAEPLRIITAFREGAYRFQGVTDGTMNHGEGWHFIQVGKYMERACDLSVLLDAHFAASAGADDLDWIGLLSSCSAFEAYCKVYTADLTAKRVAEFLLLNPEFPYSVRYSAEHMHRAIHSLADISAARKASRIERVIGKLRSSLAYLEIEEIMPRDLHAYLGGVIEQCHELHAAVQEVYIEYPIESAFEA
jgi:uncharacterized alpha-E superfamily protein